MVINPPGKINEFLCGISLLETLSLDMGSWKVKAAEIGFH